MGKEQQVKILKYTAANILEVSSVILMIVQC